MESGNMASEGRTAGCAGDSIVGGCGIEEAPHYF
jgi:hypothetical protein